MMDKLITYLKTDFDFTDGRGKLVQLVHEDFKQVNVVTSNKDVFRGGHYHKINTETFYVLYGSFRFIAELNGQKEEHIFKAGEMFMVKPNIIHSFYYLEESAIVALYDKGVELPDGGMDLYKV